MHFIRSLYIFFTILSLTLFFFSTTKVNAKSFEIRDIEISKPFENNFDKNLVIDNGFRNAFFELIYSLIKSEDVKKIEQIKLSEIKGMIESFSIKEEKFIDQIYYVNLGVSFNKKKIFKYLAKKNIFPSQIIEESFLFIPIIVDENVNDLVIFSNNEIYENWNNEIKKYHLIKYLLPTEDLEDYNLIKSKYEFIEDYDFKEITEKYFVQNSIIALIFKNDQEIRVLSKISTIQKNVIRNNTFKSFDFDNSKQVKLFINDLKKMYEDTWKKNNEINTSIKLSLIIKIDNNNLGLSKEFETTLDKIDLVNHFSVQKFNKDFIFYEVIFNGTTKKFINIMENRNYKLNTQKKVWVLK
mgnify:CR=1 FL=1